MGSINEELLAAAVAGETERVKALLARSDEMAIDGAPDAPCGLTPLMAAAAAGRDAIVELLLQRGADPTRRDCEGRSAADHARGANHPHLAERLDTVEDKEQTIW
jgi:ankyrin repeat protein